jgi:PPOX class probable F420-dependent enzyme
MSPVVCGLDDEGRVLVSTRETALKVANILRRPEVSLCVLDDNFFGQWAQVDGKAEIVPLPDAMDGLVSVYRQVAGEHPDWDDFRSAMHRERRVLVRVDVERAGPDRQG